MENDIHGCNNCDTCVKGLCRTTIINFGVTAGKNTILENVNMHIHCGELTAIIGPNGAGKSTLLKAILGEAPHAGELIFFDEKGVRTGHPLIGYVPQHLDFDLSTPASVFDLFAASISKAPAWAVGTKKTRDRAYKDLSIINAEHLINRRLGALSGGELQRVLLALAIDPVPDLLLLDEPVSGMDKKGLEIFYETVSKLRREYDLSIILVSHDLDLVFKYADRVVLLNKTVLNNGTPLEVLNDEQTERVFGLSWRGASSALSSKQERGGLPDA